MTSTNALNLLNFTNEKIKHCAGEQAGNKEPTKRGKQLAIKLHKHN